ncbi:hypothetical protein BGZ65_008038 [Modicella reniformis]|uniref:Chromo domain-containing protein n=1 Tax=Modicella reniformis TaxID=1440133 RepID=A0A9P6SP51_9FUNG|nr:hypothetical protein BGZ65_008038 [Modicella reniformis]
MGEQGNAVQGKDGDLVSKKLEKDDHENVSDDNAEVPPGKGEDTSNDEGNGNGDAEADPDADDGEDDDDDDESVFEVEKVVGHKRERGVLSYHLKWKGYPDSDNTWEKEKFVFCKGLVDAYWERYEKAGGKRTDAKGKEPKPQAAKSNGQLNTSAQQLSRRSVRSSSPALKKKNRDDDDEEIVLTTRSTNKKQKIGSGNLQRKWVQEAATGHKRKEENDSGDRASTEVPKEFGGEDKLAAEAENEEEGYERENWQPPKSWSSWDEHLEAVETVERSLLGMTVHVTWKNGKESELPLEDAHQKCPQKLIAFYEQHLKFTPA